MRNTLYYKALTTIAALSTISLQAGCQEDVTAVQPTDDSADLVVISPHSPAIRDAFVDRFGTWYEDQHDKLVTVRWLSHGTVECRDFILERYARNPKAMRIGVDVFFGGGVPIHRDIIERGFAEQIELPEELLAAIPETLNGSRLRSEDGTWFGSALSRFGILYNKQACLVRNVPVPTTWADLASADFVGWNTIADPSASGSTVKCFSLVLLSQGWQEGWGTALGILANCDGLSPSSSHVGINVRSGLALAGMAPEFVAQRLVAEHPDSLEYVNPRAMTVADPDPITVLRGAPNLEVARAFVEFVLSAEGQSLWALPPEDGGPASGPLHQNPIRPDVYETYADKLVVESNPFDRSDALQIDHQLDLAYTRLLPHLLIAANGENHLLLQKAYRTGMQQGPDSPIMKSLKEPPFPESMIQQYAARCAKDASDAAALEREWSRMFKAKYEALLDTPVAQQ